MKTWPDNNYIVVKEQRSQQEVILNLKMISEISKIPDEDNYVLFITDRDHSVIVDTADYHRVLEALGIE